MGNQLYSNFFLANEMEDQLNSHLDLQQFITINNNLVSTDGRKYKVNKYSATDSVEAVEMGSGNAGASESRLTTVEYNIKTAQGRASWYDEEEQTDSMAINKLILHESEDMFNYIMGDIYGEFKKAPMVVTAETLGFNAFADAQSMFKSENLEGLSIFAFVHPDDVAALRKALGADLKYVEAFARTGYIGTCAGVGIFTKKDADKGRIVLGLKEAVTCFNKTGVEIEPERDPNTRKNTRYIRKHFVVALTDEDKAVQILVGQTASLSEDTSVQSGKTYYAKSGLGYCAVVPAEGDNPVTKGWYEISVNP